MNPANVAPGLRRPRVLVLEDEALIALDIEEALVDAGCIVLSAPSCARARELALNEQLDCALLDVQLPDGHCADVARLLAQAGVPFALMTGLRETDLEEEMWFRATLRIPKPYPAGELMAGVRLLLSSAKRRDERSSDSRLSA